MMKSNLIYPYKESIFFFFLGCLALVMGFNGDSIAVSLSRPSNASSWETSVNMLDAYKYMPLSIGIFFLILSIISYTISFFIMKKKTV